MRFNQGSSYGNLDEVRACTTKEDTFVN